MHIKKNEILFKKFVKLQKKFFTQVLIKPSLRKGSVLIKSIKPIYHLIHLLMGVQKFHFCSPNGLHVTCICLRYGRHEQNHHRFFNKTAFIRLCVISSIKLPSYAYAQVTAGLKLYLG